MMSTNGRQNLKSKEAYTKSSKRRPSARKHIVPELPLHLRSKLKTSANETSSEATKVIKPTSTASDFRDTAEIKASQSTHLDTALRSHTASLPSLHNGYQDDSASGCLVTQDSTGKLSVGYCSSPTALEHRIESKPDDGYGSRGKSGVPQLPSDFLERWTSKAGQTNRTKPIEQADGKNTVSGGPWEQYKKGSDPDHSPAAAGLPILQPDEPYQERSTTVAEMATLQAGKEDRQTARTLMSGSESPRKKTLEKAIPDLPAAFLDRWKSAPKVGPPRHVTGKGKSAAIGKQIAHLSSENLENVQVFKSWPTQGPRDRESARIRKVIIRDLPPASTATFVMSLVYGGPLESIEIRHSTSIRSASTLAKSSASVKFLHAADCERFYEATSNGLVYGKDQQNREKVVFVELAQDVDVVGGLLSQWIDIGASRCVRAAPVKEEAEGVFNRLYLWQLAGCQGRKLEGIEEGRTATRAGCQGNRRYVVWRFCEIKDAVAFRAALLRDEEWEMCNLNFADDPCALAQGVHLAS